MLCHVGHSWNVLECPGMSWNLESVLEYPRILGKLKMSWIVTDFLYLTIKF